MGGPRAHSGVKYPQYPQAMRLRGTQSCMKRGFAVPVRQSNPDLTYTNCTQALGLWHCKTLWSLRDLNSRNTRTRSQTVYSRPMYRNAGCHATALTTWQETHRKAAHTSFCWHAVQQHVTSPCLCKTIKAHGRSGGTVPLIFKFGIRWSQAVNFTHWPLDPSLLFFRDKTLGIPFIPFYAFHKALSRRRLFHSLTR
jgi:hypothetical protein